MPSVGGRSGPWWTHQRGSARDEENAANLAHPNSQSLSGALATAYAQRAASAGAGAEAKELSLSELSFDPVLHAGYDKAQPLEPDLLRAREAIVWANHVAFVFPTWWSSAPALLRGFIDRVMQPGFAFRYANGGNGLPEKLLVGRSARVVTTMDSPRIWNVLAQGRSVHYAFARSTLGFVGFAPVRQRTLYKPREQSKQQIDHFIERVANGAEQDVRRLARRAARRGALPESGAPEVV